MNPQRITLFTVGILSLALAACGPAPGTTSEAPTTLVPATPAPTVGGTSEIVRLPIAEPRPDQLLPAPLVFQRDGQLYRLDADGVTLSQLTNEAAPEGGPMAVAEFDVSPSDGSLAYVLLRQSPEDLSGRALVLTDAGGAKRSVLFDGISATAPRFSPDGTQIAFGVSPDPANPAPALLAGVYLMPASGGKPQLVQQNATFDGAMPDATARAYTPFAWSPDESKLLIQASLPASEFCELVIKDLDSGALVVPAVPESTVTSCRGGVWSADSQSVVVPLYEPGMFGAFAGLARVGAGDGTITMIVEAEVDGLALSVESGLFPRPDGSFLGFVATSPTPFRSEPGQPQLSYGLHVIGADGRLALLRDDRQVLWSRALWANDGSGAVVVSGEAGSPHMALIWVPADGAAPVELARGQLLTSLARWGR